MVTQLGFVTQEEEERWVARNGNTAPRQIKLERLIQMETKQIESSDPRLDEKFIGKCQANIDKYQKELDEKFSNTEEETIAETVVKAPVRATKAVAQAGVDATTTVAQATVDATKTVAKAGVDATTAVVTAPVKGAKAVTDAIGLTTKTETQSEEEEEVVSDDEDDGAQVGMAVDLDGDGIPDAFLKEKGWKRDKNGRIRNRGRFVKVEELEKAKTENLSPKPKTKR